MGEAYDYLMGRFREAQEAFARPPGRSSPGSWPTSPGCACSTCSTTPMTIWRRASCCCAAPRVPALPGMIDEMVEIENQRHPRLSGGAGAFGPPLPRRSTPKLEHILITGMFHTFFELIIHQMPLDQAEQYLREMRAFYTAGWMKILGQ